MSQSFERRTMTFIVRLWMEPALGGSSPQWRGQVEPVGGGGTAYFQVPASLLELLLRHAADLREYGVDAESEESEGRS